MTLMDERDRLRLSIEEYYQPQTGVHVNRKLRFRSKGAKN